MNLYVKYFVNLSTNKTDHCITSNVPISPEVTIESKTGNLQPDPVYREIDEVLETTDKIRARDIMSLRKFNATTQKIEADATASSALKARFVRVRPKRAAVKA